MYPLTLDKPKPLLPLAGKPIIDHIIDRVQEIDSVSRIAIVSNAKYFSQFQEWIEKTKRQNVVLLNDGSTSEQDRKGAVGDLLFAFNELNSSGDTLLIAGDNYFEFSLKKLYDIASSKKSSAVALKDFKDASKIAKKFGVAEIDGSGKITGFQEKPEQPKTTLASTGCYLLTSDAVKMIIDFSKQHKVPDNLGETIAWLAEQGSVYGVVFDELWYDIGSIDQYEELQQHLASNHRP